jgi:hypothetical protein
MIGIPALGSPRTSPRAVEAWPGPLEDSTGRWGREHPANVRSRALAEPLTQREVSVLDWLTTTITMAEIGALSVCHDQHRQTQVAAIEIAGSRWAAAVRR